LKNYHFGHRLLLFFQCVEPYPKVAKNIFCSLCTLEHRKSNTSHPSPSCGSHHFEKLDQCPGHSSIPITCGVQEALECGVGEI
jgi:hypothetical protein